MRAVSLVVMVLLCLASPASAEDAVGVDEPVELVVRLEGGLGPNLCTANGQSTCERWPPAINFNQDAAGYGRLGVTFFYPELIDFIGAGLVLDLGGFSAPSGFSSVAFDLSALVRVFLAVEDSMELTGGLGLGFGHWSIDPSYWSWTGLVLPMTLGVGYELFDGWMVGGDLTFQARLTGSSPFTTQIGVYVAYTFDMSVGGGAAAE